MLFRSHVPVVWFVFCGKPGIIGGRCGPETKKKVIV
jgi:hypothetical protein